MTLGFQRNMHKDTLGKMSLTTIDLWTLNSNISAPRQKIDNKMPRMLGCSVPDAPM